MTDFYFTHGNEAMRLFQKAMYAISPLNKLYSEVSELNKFVLIQLFTSLYSTSETMIHLISDGELHDSETIFRTVIEGIINYLFMATGNLEIDNEEIVEFYTILPIFQNMRNNIKMKMVMDKYKVYTGNNHIFTLSMISEDELEELKSKYPSSIRKEMEQKWSFSNILNKLIEKNHAFKELEVLFYTYSLSSHFIHQDGNSLNFRFVTMSSLASGGESLNEAIAARMLSNVTIMFILRYHNFMNINNIISNDCFNCLKDLTDFSINMSNINEDILSKHMENI